MSNFSCQDQRLEARILALEQEIDRLRARKESLTAGYRDTFEYAGVGIAHVALNGKFLHVNTRFCDMMGYDADAFDTLTFQDLTHPDDLDLNMKEFHRLLAGEISGYRLEKRYLRSTGKYIWVDLTVSVLRDETGQPQRLISVLSDITQRKADEERRNFLLGELSHRTKNLIAVVQVIVHRLSANARDVRELRAGILARLSAISASQDALTAEDNRAAAVRDVVVGQLGVLFARDDPRIDADGPDLVLNCNATRAIAMALHELATNACKYGALSCLSGRVTIRWCVEGNLFSMSWTERGGPTVCDPVRKGFGRRVIESMVALSTNGTVQLSFVPQGVEWALKAPRAAVGVDIMHS